MINIGITGQTGFIGTHLYNTLGLLDNKYIRVPFKDEFFQSNESLTDFVSRCDVIIHLAAMNRHKDPDILYNTNISLVNQLIAACETTQSKPYILFSSSIQEELDNPYGKSKKEGCRLFSEWAVRNKAHFSCLIIPNVFGPFCHPFYNSVIATFCHQLTHNETPEIRTDAEIKTIYINELLQYIINTIEKHRLRQKSYNDNCDICEVPSTSKIKISALLNKLNQFKTDYYEKGIIPCLNNTFDQNLFSTFQCYIDHKRFFPFHLKTHTDNRGSFTEFIRINSGGQISFSVTLPDVTRGNHFHTRKVERFAVVKGRALIELRRIGNQEILSFEVNGGNPSFVDIPIWFTHNIKNIGSDELLTLFWISEHFDVNDQDTYLEVV